MDSVGTHLVTVAKARGKTLKDLSEKMGRNQAYLQQFAARKPPRPFNLSKEDREALAAALEIEPETLIRVSPSINKGLHTLDLEATTVPQYDVRVSAGGGSVIESEKEVARWQIPTAITRQLVVGRTDGLMIVEVVGDSMEPTLKSGDHLLVNRDDTDLSLPGIFALFDGSTAVVKRVEKVPTAPLGRLRLSSDNPLHGAYEVPMDTVNVAGRAVMFTRRI